MPHTAHIRIATLDDFERIIELEHLCFPREHAYSRRQLRYLLTKANSTVLVETIDALVRGFLIILYRRGTTVAGIETINVDPAFRKKGIGLRLLSAAEELLRKKEIRKIRLEVAITNTAAITLYEHAGFHQAMLLKKYYHFNHEGSRNAYRMIKELQ
ncbi:MAG TPA: GNAT family N-acetyltransferase [Thermoplasmata archaeon]|jgi:[ribosomal protein S18]-alanine N-acetyltransferase|nr:GNAT family N-acetyltransferase [Thermoplasmata archaeon]